MGLITRQELSVALRQELDDVYNYIQGSTNADMGAHMANMNNPHAVTKAQVGLGNVLNVAQVSQTDFNNHLSASNPHNLTATQIGGVPQTRTILPGAGILGGGTLVSNRTISLDVNFTDSRYLQKIEKASDSEKLDGLDSSAFHKVGTRFIDMGEGRELFYGAETNNVYFRQDGYVDRRIYHNGNIKRGTANPTGGNDGDIYIQY